MKRYLLFRGQHYYPSGGWRDFGGSYDTLDECLNAYILWLIKKDDGAYNRWAHVVDSETWKPVAQHDGSDAIAWSEYLKDSEDYQ